jgi:two-component system LytT family sensor kinase
LYRAPVPVSIDGVEAGITGVTTTLLLMTAVAVVVTAAAAALVRLRTRRLIATPAQRATYEVLHTATLAAPPLRDGLTRAGAGKAARHLHSLLGTPAIALVAGPEVLAWEGPGEADHAVQAVALSGAAARSGRPLLLRAADLPCTLLDCPLRGGVAVPLESGGRVVGVLVALAGSEPAPGLLRAALETGGWVSTQLELADADLQRDALARAEVRALRAQISPHFIYNALSAIGSLIRTDPDRARELIAEFAEFTRYSFRSHGEFTTLAEELRSIDRYLLLERARFGDRLQISIQVAPEVLPVVVPFLCLQPLVENAVRHGLATKPGGGTISIVAADAGAECHITVEDDGVGMDPALLQHRGAGGAVKDGPDEDGGEHVGLGNVDDRLRSVFGDGFGLVVETAIGAGTKVSMRVPKFQQGVRPSAPVAP